MALRTKKAPALCLSLLAFCLAAQAVEIPARHDHFRKGCDGTLQVDEQGIRFTPAPGSKKGHRLEWAWQDVQWFTVSADRIRVVTYQDVRWRLGADRAYEFRAAAGHSFLAVYQLLKNRLDGRFIAEVADPDVQPVWQVPVKRLGRLEGSEGVLKIGAGRVVYESRKPSQSVTWRYKDILSIRSSDRFHLSITGFRGELNFQLKQELAEDRYEDLWRRVQNAQGLALPQAGEAR